MHTPSRFMLRSTTNTSLDKSRLALGVAFGLALAACASHDDASSSAELENVDTAEEAYSDRECQAATANVLGSFSTLTPFNSDSPATYSNPKAFKSFVWDVKALAVSSEVYPSATLVTGGSGFPASAYDTQAECEALSFNRRLYRKDPGASFAMYAEGFAHGKWDADYGCQLPRYYGPDIKAGNTLPLGGVARDTVIRVCVSARRGDNVTIPVRVGIAGTPGIRAELFTNPSVKVGSTFYPVASDSTSAAAYCIRRGDTGLLSSTPSNSCVSPYAFFNTTFHLWRASLTTLCSPVLSSVECNLPIIQ
jgi:hypothetical protein